MTVTIILSRIIVILFGVGGSIYQFINMPYQYQADRFHNLQRLSCFCDILAGDFIITPYNWRHTVEK